MWLAVSLFALLLWLSAATALCVGMRRIESLTDVPPAADADCPSLSVVVPACDEAAAMEPALRSLLALDYPHLELIVVDDRSTDGTAAIVERLAAAHPQLRLLRVSELPSRWLGKNHALQVGSQAASGDWLLFTDADVVFHPGALRRVMAWAARRRSEHVVALPRVVVHGFWERLFVPYFMAMFNLRYRPWKVADRGSPAYLGVGAFNLVRADRYRAIGCHAALPLEVADDMKLGKLLKAHGTRSGVVSAAGWISVRWVVGLRGIVEGLTKNSFAGLEFRLGTVVLSVILQLVGSVSPSFGLFAGGPAAVTSGLALACMGLAAAAVAPPESADGGRQTVFSPGRLTAPRRLLSALWGLAFPLAALIFAYILIRSTWLTYRRGGVLWRGTLYPLEELRRGGV